MPLINQSNQQTPSGRNPVGGRCNFSRLLEMPVEKKLLSWHTQAAVVSFRCKIPVRNHPSIIRDWGINE